LSEWRSLYADPLPIKHEHPCEDGILVCFKANPTPETFPPEEWWIHYEDEELFPFYEWTPEELEADWDDYDWSLDDRA
jgi:hypothetical protein